MPATTLRHVALGLLLAFSVPAGADNPVPIDELYLPPANTSFVLSPDGKNLVNVTRVANAFYLQFTDAENMVFGSAVEIGYQMPSNIQWIADDRVSFEAEGNLFTLPFDEPRARRMLKPFDVEDGRLSTVSELKRSLNYWSVAHTLPDQPFTILVIGYSGAGYASVYSLDRSSREKKIIADGRKTKASDWLVDRNGTPQMAMRVKNDKITFFIRNPTNGKYVEHDDLHPDSAIRLNYDGRSYIDRRVIVLGYGYGERDLYLAENTTGDKFRVVRYDPIESRIVEVIHNDLRYDVGTPFSQLVLHFDDTQKALIGLTYLRDQVTSVWRDEQMAKAQATIDAQLAGRVNVIQDRSDDGSVLLVHSRTGANHGRHYLYRTATDTLILHTKHSEALEDYALPEPKTVRYPARDGYEIEAYLTLPADEAIGPHPLIVMPHGGPWVRSSSDMNVDAAFFATHGFAVLDMNYRGSTGYGREHLLSGFDKFATLMIDDIADGARWAIDEGITSTDQVFIMGWSYGGYAALMSGIRYPDLYRGLVAGAAPIDLARQIRWYRKNDRHFAYEHWRRVLGDSRADKQAQRESSPLFNLDKLDVPLILFHGSDDSVVSVDHADLFRERMAELGRRPDVRIIQGEGHGFRYVSNRAYYLEATLELFDELRASEPTANLVTR